MSDQTPKSAAPTSDAIRIAIDSGKGSDKVAFPDPSAAPLGTDDEAGGHPPTPEQRRMAAASELKRPVAPPTRRRIWPYILLVLGMLVIMLLMAIRLTRKTMASCSHEAISNLSTVGIHCDRSGSVVRIGVSAGILKP